MKRNLIVHCYPRRSGMWKRTIRHLVAGRRLDQFNGSMIFSIAHDECCDDPESVMEFIDGQLHDKTDCAPLYLVRDNTPLQEVNSFAPMLERIESRDADEFTTYIHCKGSTQPKGHASHLWCDAMAEANLDYPELLACHFARGANVVGAFRAHGLWSFPGYHNWHFAGTWFTFRHSRAFSLDWRNVHQGFMGVEAWPGIFPLAESACAFFDEAQTGHLYDLNFWRDNITPTLRYWRESLAKCQLQPLSVAKCRKSLDGRDPRGPK